MDSQAHSSYNPIGSDHRIVCAKLRLSVRAKKHSSKPDLTMQSQRINRIENQISFDIGKNPNQLVQGLC